jgi:hypothetical protein
MKIYYYDEEGFYSGEGESETVVPNATDQKPFDVYRQFNKETNQWEESSMTIEKFIEMTSGE